MHYFLVRLHTTAKAVSEAEYSSYGATKQGAQVTQVCFHLPQRFVLIMVSLRRTLVNDEEECLPQA